jgi:DNA-binding winged helix-turn-helix (wHTH) protein/tetratricopeptide (TPR) repeat protein
LSITFTQKVFPPFRLDPINQCLWRENERISLAPKAFGVLRYLVENPGRLVTQEELLEALWPETYVQPEVLRKYILDIRKVLGDPPKKPLFIETLPRRGYQFIAPVAREGQVAPAGVAVEAPAQHLPGRELALAELTAHLNAALRGTRQLVFVTGEAGIGKTTLIDAFEQRIARTVNLLIARGQCVEGFAGKEAYYPVLEALGHLLRAPGADSLLPLLSTHAPAWLMQFPSAVPADRREALQRESIGATRERMVRELSEALEKLTTDQALVLILEDLHWVDDSTLDLISALARRRGVAKLLIVASYRPVEVILSSSPLKGLKQDLLVRRLCHEITLERLTEPQVQQFLGETFADSALTQPLGELIHRRSDGNPMFMVALVDQLRDKGFVVEEAGKWVLSRPLDKIGLDIPPTLQQMLEIQLDQLTAEELALLRAASVVGLRFSSWAAGTLLGGDIRKQEEICERLARRQQFLKSAGAQELPDGSESLQYEFKHALYRDVLYRQIPVPHARAMHLRLAEQTETLWGAQANSVASELSVHFENGRSHGRAVPYLIAAAANAARRYAHDDSLRLLRHALELLPHLAPDAGAAMEIQILERIGDALYAQGDMDQSGEIDRKINDLAASRGFIVPQVNALTRLARVLAFADPDRCVAVCERAVEVCKAADDPLLQARTEMLAACWRIITYGWTQEDAVICASARQRIRALSDDLPAYHEILYAHVQWIQGDYQDAYKTAQAGILQAVEDDSLVVYLSAHSSLVQALLPMGRIGELLQVLDRALDVSAKNRNSPWLGIFQAMQGWLRLQMQDLEGARRTAEDLLRRHTEEPPGQVRTIALVTLAFVEMESGQMDRAIQRFGRVCDRPVLPRFFLDWHWRLVAQLGLASARLAKGDLEPASEAAEALVKGASAADPALRSLAWELRARVSIAGKKMNDAKDCIQRALEALTRFDVPLSAWKVHATAAVCDTSSDHRARARGALAKLTGSLSESDPLRQSLVSAEPVRKILAD